jgi:Ca2+-binding EF-hand superfamily protein
MNMARPVRAILAAIATLMVSSALRAQTAPTPTEAPSPTAASQPATSPADSQPASAPAKVAVPDHVQSLLDQYDAVKERQKFLAAAGVDNEMDQKLFDADKAKGDGFVRPFDRWEAMLRFDKNGNKSIDWFEADAYRQDLRQKLLAAFNAAQDGKLTTDERDRANRALDRGWAGFTDAARARLAAGGPGAGPAGGAGPFGRRLDRAEIIRKYDKDGDGQLSEEERAAAIKDFQDEQQQEMLKKYDKDGDGKLSEEELAAMREDQQKQAQPWQKMAEKINRRLFETDEDGQLTEVGKAQAKEFQKQLQALAKVWDVRFNDLDGDGNVSPEERKQVQAAWRMQSLRLISMTFRYLDADGDGKVTVEEREAFMQRAQVAVEKWVNKFIDRYDTSGTGKLDEEQRAQFIKGIGEEIEKRVKKFDTEGKGRTTPAQTLDMLEDFAKELGLAPKPKTPAPPTEEEEN